MISILRVDQDTFFYKLLVFSILVFPLTYIGELIALFQGGFEDSATVYSPLFLKGLKDLIFIFLVFYLVIKTMKRGFFPKIKIFWIYMVFLVILPIFLQQSYIFVLFGIRWMLPIILTAFMIGFINRSFLEKMTNFILLMYFLHFITQLLQIIWMPPFFGFTLFNITRSQGLFSNTNTGAMFTIFSLYLAIFFSSSSRLRFFALLSAPLSLIFIASGTGIVLGVILYISFILWSLDSYRPRMNIIYFRLFLYIILCIAPLFTFLFLNDITGRGDDYIEISGGSRVVAFSETLSEASLLSERFGSATNTAVLASKSGIINEDGAFGSDSMYQSAIVNFGVPLGILFLLLPAVSILSKKSELIPRIIFFIILYSTYSVTQIVETYPLNLILSVLLSYFSLGRRSY
jgi:hypothetical protein